MEIVKTFSNDMLMTIWLSNSDNVDELKSKYPPKEYDAVVNLMDKQIEVTKKIIQPNLKQE